MGHSVPMKFARPALALLCVAVLGAACSSGDAEAGPTAEEEFCSAFRPYVEAAQADQDATEAEIVARMKKFADEVSGLRTPEEMSKDAAKGLETWVDRVTALPDDASQTDVMEALNADVSDAEKAQMEAFINYGNQACLKAPVTE